MIYIRLKRSKFATFQAGRAPSHWSFFFVWNFTKKKILIFRNISSDHIELTLQTWTWIALLQKVPAVSKGVGYRSKQGESLARSASEILSWTGRSCGRSRCSLSHCVFFIFSIISLSLSLSTSPLWLVSAPRSYRSNPILSYHCIACMYVSRARARSSQAHRRSSRLLWSTSRWHI
jgi:hypothetical protein